MSYVPTPFGHLQDWRVDPRDPRPTARLHLQASVLSNRKERR